MSMLTNDYVVGLADGEGSFTVYVRDNRKPHRGIRRVQAEPKFCLKLIEKDKAILYELKEFFGCGNVYFQKDTRPNHQHCYRYEVAKREDIENIIIPFFRSNHLQFSSKQKDFSIFCDLVERIKHGEHLTSDGLANLYRIKQEMH